MNQKISSLGPTLGRVFLSALMFSVVAIHNGYPLTFGDTFSHIEFSFTFHYFEQSRPFFYGLLLAGLRPFHSLWAVVFAQAALVSFILEIFLEVETTLKGGGRFLVVSALALGSSLAWPIAVILPDFLSPCLALSTYLLLRHRDLGFPKNIFLNLVFVGSCVSSYSILAAEVGTLLLVGLLLATGRRPFSLPRARHVALLLGASLLIVLGTNRILYRKSSVALPGPAFLMGELIEYRILAPLLQEHCAQENYILCPYTKEISQEGYWYWDFLTNHDGPLYRVGGWIAARDELVRIELDALRFYPKKIMVTAIRALMASLVRHSVREWTDQSQGQSAGVYKRFPHETAQFLRARQQTKRIAKAIAIWDYSETIFLALSFILGISSLTFTFYKRQSMDSPQIYFIYALTFVMTNAMVCSWFSTGSPRYTERTMCLLILAGILFAVKSLRLFAKTRLSQTKSSYAAPQ